MGRYSGVDPQRYCVPICHLDSLFQYRSTSLLELFEVCVMKLTLSEDEVMFSSGTICFSDKGMLVGNCNSNGPAGGPGVFLHKRHAIRFALIVSYSGVATYPRL